MATINLKLINPEFGFEAVDQQGATVKMDTSEESGGHHYGVRPMQNLLAAMGGCSGIDVVSILKKQRQPYTSIEMTITGEREKDKVPALWIAAHISFVIGGDVDEDKAKYAAKLSIEKYCSVAETLRRAGCTITWDVEVRK